jgi:hypothetical protein
MLKGGQASLYLFAQRSWQTHPLERKWNHPDGFLPMITFQLV